jgi:hypothetical protein
MANFNCNFTIPAGGNGGELQGQGLGGNPPLMNAMDTLTVVVKWAGNPNTAPSALTGYYVFSPAAANQTAPSPFLQDGNYLCFKVASANLEAGSNPPTYTFQGLVYGGLYPGNYELTFVAEAYTSTPACIQWSKDPEFDTSN